MPFHDPSNVQPLLLAGTFEWGGICGASSVNITEGCTVKYIGNAFDGWHPFLTARDHLLNDFLHTIDNEPFRLLHSDAESRFAHIRDVVQLILSFGALGFHRMNYLSDLLVRCLWTCCRL